MAYKKSSFEKNKASMIQNMKDKYFTFIFVSASLLAILILVFLSSWMRNSLFIASDLVKKESGSQGFNARPVNNFFDPKLEAKGETLVKLYYFSDFNCAFCLEQLEVIKEVYAQYSDVLTVSWKDYPDYNLNSFSYQAARAARCAQEQGSFWQYGLKLKDQSAQFTKYGQDIFTNIANNVNLNITDFNACINDNKVDELIVSNINEATNLGISAIPYIYINSVEFIGGLNKEELINIIEMELNK